MISRKASDWDDVTFDYARYSGAMPISYLPDLFGGGGRTMASHS